MGASAVLLSGRPVVGAARAKYRLAAAARAHTGGSDASYGCIRRGLAVAAGPRARGPGSSGGPRVADGRRARKSQPRHSSALGKTLPSRAPRAARRYGPDGEGRVGTFLSKDATDGECPYQ
jgi:hypothetical protein